MHQQWPVLEMGGGSPLRPILNIFTCYLRSDPHTHNMKWAQKFIYHFTQSLPCSLLSTVSLTLPSALGTPVACSRQKAGTLISLPCHELLQMCLRPWPCGRRTERRRKQWGFIACSLNHTSYGQREGLLSLRVLDARPASTATVPLQDFLGPSVGENAIKSKRDDFPPTHSLWAPGFPCPTPWVKKTKAHLEAFFICTWCAGLAFRWTWNPASFYLKKNKWKFTACLLVLWNLTSFPNLPAAIFNPQIITPASVQVYNCVH